LSRCVNSLPTGILHPAHDESVFGKSDLLVIVGDFMYIFKVSLTNTSDLRGQVADDAITHLGNKDYISSKVRKASGRK
jgi:hypothetical protein